MEKTWMDYQTDAYERELDAAAEILQEIHPLGKVKAIGRREVAEALRDVAIELKYLRGRAEAGAFPDVDRDALDARGWH